MIRPRQNPKSKIQNPKSRSRAFSLLEVILAFAILAGAVAIFSELSRGALENAGTARDLARAELLCESKLAEIAACILVPEAQAGVPFESEIDPTLAEWQYSIEVNPAIEPDMLEVRITVMKDPTVESRPVECSLVSWVIDPDVLATLSASTESTETEDVGAMTGGEL